MSLRTLATLVYTFQERAVGFCGSLSGYQCLFFQAAAVTYVPPSLTATRPIVTHRGNDGRQRDVGDRRAPWEADVRARCLLLVILSTAGDFQIMLVLAKDVLSKTECLHRANIRSITAALKISWDAEVLLPLDIDDTMSVVSFFILLRWRNPTLCED